MTYGIRVSEESYKYLNLVEEGNSTEEHLISGTSILEFIPALARLPTWLPGTSFLRTLERGREAVLRMRTVPWNDTKHGLVASISDYTIVIKSYPICLRRKKLNMTRTTLQPQCGSAYHR